MANKITAKLLEQIIEGALLVSGKAISVSDVKNYFGEDDIVPHITDIRSAFKKLEKRYKARGIELKEVASGYRFQVSEQVAPYVIKQWEEKPQKYSRALLETLALIAYRQPITRGDIEDIRGVSVSSNIVRTLLEREWVRVVGHKDVPGRPALFATTSKFLDYFNLKSLTELPELSEVKDLEAINPELDFGDEFQLSPLEAPQDPKSEFDGDSADLIPDTQEPVESAIDELTEAEKEEIRLAKVAANKEKELQQELAAREELQDIDRFNSAFEKMIRSPDAQTNSAQANSQREVPVEGDDLADTEADHFEQTVEESKSDLPGWWTESQVEQSAQSDNGSADDEGANEEIEVPVVEEKKAGSRFAQWADQLEASVHEVEQQELLQESLHEEFEADGADSVALDVDRFSSLEDSSEGVVSSDAPASDDAESGVEDVIDNSEAESRLTERTYGQQISGDEMSEEDIQRLIQQKLAEQAALMDKKSSEEDSED